MFQEQSNLVFYLQRKMKIWHQLQNENKIQRIDEYAWNQKRQQIEKRLEGKRNKWCKKLEESITIWMNLVELKIKNCLKSECQKQNRNQMQGLSLLQTEMQYIEHNVEEQLKKIDVILLGELSSKKQSKKHKNENARNPVSELTTSKSRSGSFNMPRNRKYSMFNTDSFRETTHTQAWKQSLNYQRMGITGGIVKQGKKKPKFETEETNKKEEIDKGLASTVQNFLQMKSVLKEKKAEQNLTSMIGQKMMEVQLSLSTKLDNLMENITQRIKEISEKKSDEDTRQKQKYIEMVLKQSEILKEELRLNLKLKQEELERQKCFEEDQIKKNKTSFHSLSNKNIIKRESDKKQINSTTNQVGVKSEQFEAEKIQKQKGAMKIKESNFNQFINLTKKIKLPINDQLLKIFSCSYMKICQSQGFQPCESFMQMTSKDQQYTIGISVLKIELKDCLTKLKKLYGMDGMKAKAEKIKLYIDHCLRCTYDIVLCLQHESSEDTLSELERAISKL